MKQVFAVVFWNGFNYDDYDHETIIIVADDEKEANELALESTNFGDFGGLHYIPSVFSCTVIPHLKSDLTESNVFLLPQN
jgi:hypothetical protein